MDVHVKITSEEYAGLLAFISEELVEKKQKKVIESFFTFRYKTKFDSNTEHVLISVKGYDENFRKDFIQKIEKLIKNGVILGLEKRGWNFDHYVFGEKGVELAKDIFSLGTEFAIAMREKFGKLLDPQNEYPEEVMQRFISPGAWLLMTSFFNTAGYSPIQEINAYITALQSLLRFMPEKEADKVRNMLRLTLDMM
ncbi:MAG: hypothetical protein HeimC3_51020 [Candidatus Heimdallarchaeota archaeon LC_3]|nr:MAG: hypothetical protein HeimC3_51020 [Candidatus Heimdallarchaeota archaeon LC_3]